MTSSVDCNCKFSELNFSTPAVSKAMSKLFSSQGCSDDKNCVYFSSIFFKICRFRSSILLSLLVFIPREATLESGLTVAGSFSTSHNSLLHITTNKIASFCIDHRSRQMAFFSCKGRAKAGQKGRLSRYVEIFCNKKGFSLLYKTNIFHVAVRLIQ